MTGYKDFTHVTCGKTISTTSNWYIRPGWRKLRIKRRLQWTWARLKCHDMRGAVHILVAGKYYDKGITIAQFRATLNKHRIAMEKMLDTPCMTFAALKGKKQD